MNQSRKTTNMRVKTKQKTFTLIELIMVMVIIGIIATIAIPKFINMRQDAQNAAAEGTIGALKSAIYLYHSQTSIPEYYCLCLASSDANSCNNYNRQTSVTPPCYPATIEELNSLLTTPSDWVLNNGCYYDSDTGSYTCP
jgi:prepilin-type N-terminal cleavage/methylation domain-containing protein